MQSQKCQHSVSRPPAQLRAHQAQLHALAVPLLSTSPPHPSAHGLAIDAMQGWYTAQRCRKQ